MNPYIFMFIFIRMVLFVTDELVEVNMHSAVTK